MKIRIIVICIFCLTRTLAQQLNSLSPIQQKSVIGFPAVTAEQLNQIKSVFQNFPQITSAKFIGDANHQCMLLKIENSQQKFTYYDELLKTIQHIYDIKNCFIKDPQAYDEISANTKAGTEIILK